MVADLIYDVGMHNGKDTAQFLAQGFQVVPIKANPVYGTAAREEFSEAIAAARLHVLEAAISDRDGVVDFFVCRSPDTAWSTLDASVAQNRSVDENAVYQSNARTVPRRGRPVGAAPGSTSTHGNRPESGRAYSTPAPMQERHIADRAVPPHARRVRGHRGVVARDSRLPSPAGRYLYSDLCGGEIRPVGVAGGRASDARRA